MAQAENEIPGIAPENVPEAFTRLTVSAGPKLESGVGISILTVNNDLEFIRTHFPVADAGKAIIGHKQKPPAP
jgi:hypothetical protein